MNEIAENWGEEEEAEMPFRWVGVDAKEAEIQDNSNKSDTDLDPFSILYLKLT